MSNQQSLREYLVSRIAELDREIKNGVLCPSCDGEGALGNSTCSRCQGVGRCGSNSAGRVKREMEQALERLDNTIKQVEVMTPFKTFETKGKNWIWKGEVLELLKGKTCPACNTNHKGECPNAHGSWE